MVERLLALAVLAASGIYLANAMPLPAGTAARPGPGFFPLVVGGFAALVALAWVVTAFRRPAMVGDGAAPPAGGRARVTATTATLFGFCLALPWIGYPVAAFGFVAVLLRSLSAGWILALAIGLGSALGSYYLFGVLLGVPLPRGALFD